ncbi:MAG: hypothetical protein K2M87_00395 [Muribaculaceae bacterium]|nr:hypothetical protein [Muribaculaceae bacterium]
MHKFTLPVLALAAMSVPAIAQSEVEKPNDPGNKVTFIKTSQDTTVYNILKKDRSKDVNEIPVPHFAIHTQNNKFVMTIGAQINPIIGADMGSNLYKNPNAGINFVPSAIYAPGIRDHKSDFYINALNAAVDLQVVGFGGTDNQITGYLKISTAGNDNHIKLSKAYLTWRGLTAGLKNSLFVDESVCPPTIDPQGPNGYVSTTVTEIGYVSPTWSGFSFGAGLDMPTYYSSNGVYRGKDYHNHDKDQKVSSGTHTVDPDGVSMKIPDIPMYVQWGTSDLNRVRLGAIIRPLMYKDLLNDSRRTTVGWGLSLSGNINPVEPLIFYLQATYGKGIGAYIQDTQGLPLSFTPKDGNAGHMTPTPMMGWLAGVTYNINPKWQINAMASQARVWKCGAYANAQAEQPGNVNDYSYGYYGAANVFYNLSSYLQFGVEYLYGYRHTFNHQSGHDNRIQMQVMFTL